MGRERSSEPDGSPREGSANTKAHRHGPTRRRASAGRRRWVEWLSRSCQSFPRRLARELTTDRIVSRWVSRLQAMYLLVMIGTWGALITLSETWLPATILAYGPRFVVLLPLAMLLPFGMLFAQRSLVFSFLAAAVGLHGIMGFRAGISSSLPERPAAGNIRILSLNIQGGGIVADRLSELLDFQADVLHFQECSDLFAALVRQRGLYVTRYRTLCTASRWPIVSVDSMPRQAFESVSRFGFGGTAYVMRTIISHPAQALQTVNLHLETPRKGLEAILNRSGESQVPDDLEGRLPIDPTVDVGYDINTRVRDRESERAAGWAARRSLRLPLLVAGDFNLPVESSIYRRYWGGFRNAFEERGVGFGHTKVEGRLIRARIDHVLFRPGSFEVVFAGVGPDIGSDHRPVVADLRFTENLDRLPNG